MELKADGAGSWLSLTKHDVKQRTWLAKVNCSPSPSDYLHLLANAGHSGTDEPGGLDTLPSLNNFILFFTVNGGKNT